MKKKFLALILALIAIMPVFSGCFVASDNPFLDETDYVELINDVTIHAMKFNVAVEFVFRESFFSDKKATTGSGVIIKKKVENEKDVYWVVTNNHVVDSKDVTIVELSVYNCFGNGLDGEILYSDSTRDLSLLKVVDHEGTWEGTAVASFSSSNAQIGQEIISLGQPLGQSNAFTIGKILNISSAPETDNGKLSINVISHNAYINKGSSGGALINTKLELVGINYAGAVNESSGEFLCGYSIPLVELNEFLQNNGVSL